MNEANQDIKQVDKHCTAEEFLIDDDNRPQAQMVRKAYDEMDCMFGTYFPYHMSLHFFLRQESLQPTRRTGG